MFALIHRLVRQLIGSVELEVAFKASIAAADRESGGILPVARLRLTTSGRPEITGADGRPLQVARQQLALFVYLMLEGPSGQFERSRLNTLLWRTPSEEALSTALNRLRQIVGSDVLPAAVKNAPVVLRREFVSCDVLLFEEAIDAHDYQRADGLHPDRFLEEWTIAESGDFGAWAIEKRRRLDERYRECLQNLARRHAREGRTPDAVDCWLRAANTYLASGSVVASAMRGLDAIGARETAIDLGDLHTRLVRETSSGVQSLVTDLLGEWRRGPSETAAPGTGVGREVVRSRRVSYAGFLGVATVLGVVGALLKLSADLREPAGAEAAYDRTAIAVLPFENLSAEGEHAYFAPGLHDELITQLSKVAELTVIGRTSVMNYEGTASPLRKITTELGVGSVVEGSVQVVANRLRVNVQLIDAVRGTNIWAERYDRALEDAFEIQSEIAQHIVAAVVPTLGPAQQLLLADLPTENAQAYEHYLLGMARFRAGFPVGPALFEAVAMLEKAVELDPAFALAHARLSISHGGIYWSDRDQSEERLEQARNAADRALQISPGLMEGRLALALYWYWGHRDYDRALHELNPLLTLHPNNAEITLMAAAVQRRAGRFTEAAANLAKASDLDPLWWSAALEAGTTFLTLRQYELAERYLQRLDAIDASPRSSGAMWAYLRLMRGDRTDDVRRWLRQRGGDHSFAEEMATAAHGGAFLGHLWRVVRSLCGDCEDALELTRPDNREWLQQGDPRWRYYVAKGVLYASMKRSAVARTYFDSAAAELQPEALAPRTLGLWALPYVHAALGRRRAAMRAAERLARSLPVQMDAWAGTSAQLLVAEISVLAGEYELALDKLEWLLSVPSWISTGILRADPIWDPIREHPRFQRLMAHGTP